MKVWQDACVFACIVELFACHVKVANLQKLPAITIFQASCHSFLHMVMYAAIKPTTFDVFASLQTRMHAFSIT